MAESVRFDRERDQGKVESAENLESTLHRSWHYIDDLEYPDKFQTLEMEDENDMNGVLDDEDPYFHLDNFNLDDLLHSLRMNEFWTEEVLPFPHGEKASGTCKVCFDFTTAHRRDCCSQMICDDCIEQYCVTDVRQGILKIHCPIPHCKAFITKDEIVYRLPNDMKEKFNKYLIDANADPCIKTCPRCSHITKLEDRARELEKRKVKKRGLPICCTECDLKWCFPCQAPWHEGITCKQFRSGDKLVKDWAHTVNPGSRTRNAVRCPRCKVFIERTEGCDHMHCSKCFTEFCYRCGDKYRSLKFLGNHHDRYSVFGCKYRLKPGKPHERKLIRGAILGGKILALPAVAVFAVGAGAIILLAGALIGPFYGGYKLHQARMRMKQNKKWRCRRNKRDDVRISGFMETPPMIHRTVPLNQFNDNDEKIADFDNDFDGLKFYDAVLSLEKLQSLQMRKSDWPVHNIHEDGIDGDGAARYSGSESSLSSWSDYDILNLPQKDDPGKCGWGQGQRGSRMGRQSLSSDSDTEELDSLMFVLDSAGKVYSTDNSSLRASKDTIVEYVAAVSETTHL